jgi:hypothetical protein
MELLIPAVAFGGLYALTRPTRPHEGLADSNDDDLSYDYDPDPRGDPRARPLPGDAFLQRAPAKMSSPTDMSGAVDDAAAAFVRPGAGLPAELNAPAPGGDGRAFQVELPNAPRGAGADDGGGGASARYAGGAAFQSGFFAPTALGGVPGSQASAAPFFRGAEAFSQLGPAGAGQPRLDRYTGAGHLLRQKQPMAPLFAPATDLSYAYGAPNQTDALRAREYVSMKQGGVNPGPVLHEGRGLTLDRSAAGMAAELGAIGPNGHVDYVSRGTYVDALAARDLWAGGRGVDEMRTADNPKVGAHFMAGFEGPATLTTAGGARLHADVPTPKNRPETFFENVLGLWRGPSAFRHTQTIEPEFFAVAQQSTQRERTEAEGGGSGYMGAAGPGGAVCAVGSYLMEQEVEPDRHIGPSELAPAQGGHIDGLTSARPGTVNDYGRYTQPIFDTNRSAGPQQTYFGQTFSSVLTRFVAPLADALRPARRTALAEASNDTHGQGQFSGAGLGGFGSGTAAPGLVAAHLLPTTLREEGMLEDAFGQVSAADKRGAHHDQNPQLHPTERESTTAHSAYLGAAPRGPSASLAEGPAAEQTRADREREQTLHGRASHGAAGQFTPQMGAAVGHRKPDAAAPGRAPVASFAPAGPSAATFGAVVSRYDHAAPPPPGAWSSAPRGSAAPGAGLLSDEGLVGAAAVNRRRTRDDADFGGGAFSTRGAPARGKHPSEHNFSAQTELNAQIRSKLQKSNPLVQEFRV